jgi:hypothetical protein
MLFTFSCLWVLISVVQLLVFYEEPLSSGSLKIIKIKKRLESSLNLISFRIFIMNLKKCLNKHQSSVPSATIEQKIQ